MFIGKQSNVHQHEWSASFETKVLLRPAAQTSMEKQVDKFGPVSGYDILTQQKCLVSSCEAVITIDMKRTKL